MAPLAATTDPPSPAAIDYIRDVAHTKLEPVPRPPADVHSASLLYRRHPAVPACIGLGAVPLTAQCDLRLGRQPGAGRIIGHAVLLEYYEPGGSDDIP